MFCSLKITWYIICRLHLGCLSHINLVTDYFLLQVQVVRICKGLPLAIKVIGRSLSHQPSELWLRMVEELSQHSILDSNTELLTCLQKILNVLEDDPAIKECFMDLGLFPEDQRISVTTLIDMWAESCSLDDNGTEAMAIIKKLDSMNLANVLVARYTYCLFFPLDYVLIYNK